MSASPTPSNVPRHPNVARGVRETCIKGVLRPADAVRLETLGADALWVSNHAGRQFDGAPASIDALPAVRTATTLPLIFDSGVETGLDILRALASGADFVMLGRAFHFALAALGPKGIDHLIDLLRLDLIANMGQLGAKTLTNLPEPFDLNAPPPSKWFKSPCGALKTLWPAPKATNCRKIVTKQRCQPLRRTAASLTCRKIPQGKELPHARLRQDSHRQPR